MSALEARRLRRRTVRELKPRPPFAFDASFHHPDHFPSSDNAWEPGTRWQTVRWQGRSVGLRVDDRGSVDRPLVRVSVYADTPLSPAYVDDLCAELAYRWTLVLDLSEFNDRFADDPQLGPVIERWRGMRPLNFNSLYEYLVIAIVLQNAIVRRSVQMLQALFDRYGALLAYDGRALYGFWDPETLASAHEEDLRALKVGYRAIALRRVSQAIAAKTVDELALRGAQLEEKSAALRSLHGVGPASAGYLLVGVFHELDELSHISPWEQRIYSKLFFDADPDQPVPVPQLLELFERRFAGYRALAVHYLWEDLFWRRLEEPVEWLEKLIRL